MKRILIIGGVVVVVIVIGIAYQGNRVNGLVTRR